MFPRVYEVKGLHELNKLNKILSYFELNSVKVEVFELKWNNNLSGKDKYSTTKSNIGYNEIKKYITNQSIVQIAKNEDNGMVECALMTHSVPYYFVNFYINDSLKNISKILSLK